MHELERKVRARFRSFAETRGDEDSALAEGALHIAAEARDATFDVADHLARLDAITARVLPALEGASTRRAKLVALVDELHGRLGFRGNADDYYDPANSFLDEVLVRRTGLPITLSIVYLHVGRAAGLKLAGVAFPGHFLVRTTEDDGSQTLFIDPFHAGRIRTADELGPFLSSLTGGRITLDHNHLAPVGTRAILVRMLHNLKALYSSRAEWLRAIDAVDRILLLAPHAHLERRDRGVLYTRLGAHVLAVSDFEAYLAAGAPGDDKKEVRALVAELRKKTAVAGAPS